MLKSLSACLQNVTIFAFVLAHVARTLCAASRCFVCVDVSQEVDVLHLVVFFMCVCVCVVFVCCCVCVSVCVYVCACACGFACKKL